MEKSHEKLLNLKYDALVVAGPLDYYDIRIWNPKTCPSTS